jgi:protein O-GlcNAc transferase
MDPYTYFLSFSRLAPIQAVSIGHAETSGVPNIDYFLSSELFETPTSSSHYSEQLVRLPSLPGYYFRPEPPAKQYIRNDYGLPETSRLYVYPQSLFKIHPNFDETIGKLLRQDPNGRLVLIEGWNDGHWEKLLCERFSRQFPDVVGQVIFIPSMAREKFLGLLILADAILDNPYLSGVTSCLEAFGVGAPIVAWPGKSFSGRCVTACYKQMGLTDLIATDEKYFLKLALKLAQDKEFKLQMQTKIKANSHKLFERLESVREIESFFLSAHEQLRTNQSS